MLTMWLHNVFRIQRQPAFRGRSTPDGSGTTCTSWQAEQRNVLAGSQRQVDSATSKRRHLHDKRGQYAAQAQTCRDGDELGEALSPECCTADQQSAAAAEHQKSADTDWPLGHETGISDRAAEAEKAKKGE